MSEISVAPETFRQYGSITGDMAATVAGVGAVDQAATVAAVAPVFGLIGQDFLTSFAYSQANHFAGVNALANVYEQTSLTAHNSAAAYENVEGDSAGGFTLPK
jgi:hypothetical protein